MKIFLVTTPEMIATYFADSFSDYFLEEIHEVAPLCIVERLPTDIDHVERHMCHHLRLAVSVLTQCSMDPEISPDEGEVIIDRVFKMFSRQAVNEYIECIERTS